MSLGSESFYDSFHQLVGLTLRDFYDGEIPAVLSIILYCGRVGVQTLTFYLSTQTRTIFNLTFYTTLKSAFFFLVLACFPSVGGGFDGDELLAPL